MKYTYLLLVLLTFSACTSTVPIQDGRLAHERKQFSVAKDLLQKEYRKAKSRVEKGKLAFLLGESYEALNKSDDAIEWYRIAYDNGFGVDALERHAYTLLQAEQYKEALQAFKDLGLEIGSPYEYRREMRAAEFALAWQQKSKPEYKIYPTDFNTSSAEYSPTLYQADQMVITSDRSTATGKDNYNWTGRSFSDLYLVDLNAGTVEQFDAQINTEANEGTAAFYPGGSEVYFTRCEGEKKADAYYCKIYRSEVTPDGGWGPAKPLSFTKAGINYLHPAVSPDGQLLYFSAKDPDEGWGGYDIYVSERTSEGTWDEPRVMGRSINTVKDEQFPYVDGDTLYFASDGHIGLGGLDIFKTYLIRDDRWAQAKNMYPPINSGADDFGIVFTDNGELPDGVLREGYFTSRRFDGAGGDDIYRFERIPKPPKPDEPEPEKIVAKMILEVYVLEKIFDEPGNPNSRLLGRKPLEGANLSFQLPGKAKETITLNDSGKYEIEIDEDQEYDFLADAEGFFSNEGAFSSAGIARPEGVPEVRYELEIVLDRIYVNQELTLENIYYDLDKAFIRDDAKPTLDRLAEVLTLNPEIRIQLGSHTDCRASNRYNQDLSQRRAQSAVDYLISKGVDPNRLRARGYGEEKPAIDCACSRCSEEEHQSNRRTTFEVLEN